MTPHPAADLFPPMSDEEYADLKEDIGKNGLLDPITTHEGQILDGRHRLRACEELGVTPVFQGYEGDDPVGFVVSINLKRRHLSTSQRAMLAADIANMAQGRRTDLQPSANLPEVSQPQAARMSGVSQRSLRDAKALQRQAPDLAAQVRHGEKAIGAAVREAKARTPNPSEGGDAGDWARTDQNHAYRELLDKAKSGAETLRSRLSAVVHSRPETRVHDGPMPTDSVARELETQLKAKLARIAELGAKLPGGRMVEASASGELEMDRSGVRDHRNSREKPRRSGRRGNSPNHYARMA